MIGAAKKAELAIRDARIAAAYMAGELQAEIAEREGISRALVSIILKKQDARLPGDQALERFIAGGQAPAARRRAAESNSRPLSDRFFEKVRRGNAPDDCWEWTGAVSGSGRPQIIWERRKRQATHIALVLHGKPRPNGLYALHKCDNPNCVNPKHLWWGTQKENIQDALAKGRMDLSGLALAPQLLRRPTYEFAPPEKPGRVEVEIAG